jgi:hypothetical protein
MQLLPVGLACFFTLIATFMFYISLYLDNGSRIRRKSQDHPVFALAGGATLLSNLYPSKRQLICQQSVHSNVK